MQDKDIFMSCHKIGALLKPCLYKMAKVFSKTESFLSFHLAQDVKDECAVFLMGRAISHWLSLQSCRRNSRDGKIVPTRKLFLVGGRVAPDHNLIKVVHVIRVSFPSTNMSRQLRLNCLVLNDDPSQMFTFEIEDTKTVAELKKAVKGQKRLFDDVPAADLVLWKVSIPTESDAEMQKMLEGFTPDTETPLRSAKKLNILFPKIKETEDDDIRVLVQIPKGEYSDIQVTYLHGSCSGPRSSPAPAPATAAP